jgi:hypothetical protein
MPTNEGVSSTNFGKSKYNFSGPRPPRRITVQVHTDNGGIVERSYQHEGVNRHDAIEEAVWQATTFFTEMGRPRFIVVDGEIQ